MDKFKTDKEVKQYLKPYTERDGSLYDKLITVYKPHKDVLSVRCDVISAFESKGEMLKVKGYLRRNGFHSNGWGTYSRYKTDKGKIIGPYEWKASHIEMMFLLENIR